MSRVFRFLARLLPEDEREFILGDLEEIRATEMLPRYGPLSARLWYAGALLQAAVALRHRPGGGPRVQSQPGNGFMRAFQTDLRYALRQLAGAPGFTALAVVTLALGIGATTTIVSVVSPVLFRPLPYPHPERIVSVWERDQDGNESNLGYPTFRDLEASARSFDGLAAMSSWQPTIQGAGESERLDGQRVTESFFSVLGVRPELGRDFRADEQVRDRRFAVILSHGLWQRRFGGDAAVVGRAITLNGLPYTVVGVLPKRFEPLLAPTAVIWAPLAYDASLPWACRTCRHLRAVGRLKEGIPLQRAGRELDLLSARMVTAYPREYSAAGMLVIPLQTLLTREVRPALLAVLGAVAFVLLIACANVSGLLLGRAMQRETEFAIRGALGAGRTRVVRQLLTESVLLALLGGGAGAALAWWGVKLVLALGPATLPRLQAIRLDGRMLGVAAGLSVATGLLFGLVPALSAARPDLFAALRPGGRQTGQRSRRSARAVLVAGEVALALMLLVGAGLLLRSLDRLLAVDPGFDPRGLLTLEVQTTGPRYERDPAVRAYFERALEAVRAVPGVERAGWTSMLPLGGNFDRYGVQIEGKLLANPEDAPSADRYAVSPGYVEAMRIPLRGGRVITAADATDAPPVVLINQAFARLGWPAEDPLGKRVRLGDPNGPWRTIVGIVGDVHHTGLDERQAPQIYLPEAQWISADGAMVLAARTRGDPAALISTVRATLRALDPSLPVLHEATMEQVLSSTTRPRRFALVLFEAFAAVALLLAAAGIYAVLAGNVTQRTRELGIRAALGASRSGLLGMVVAQGLSLTGLGIAVGTAGALLLSRLLRGLLFGVGPRDPLTFLGVVVVLIGVALLACWAPAWRATRVDPVEALRAE